MKYVALVFLVACAHKAPVLPPEPQGPACTGTIEAHAGLAAVDDPELLASAIAKDGEGKLCMGAVYEVTEPVTVYRVWTAAKPYTQIGGWWSFDAPQGPADAYRAANAICPEWSALDMVSRCTVKVGAHLVVGPGQSATCEGGVAYGQSPVNQVFIANDTRIDQVFVEDCTPGEAWPAP